MKKISSLPSWALESSDDDDNDENAIGFSSSISAASETSGAAGRKKSSPSNSTTGMKISNLPSHLTRKIISLLSDHLEYTKLQILQSVSISLSQTEHEYLGKFFVDTDIELDSEMEYLMKYWREEFMLRLKSKQQLLVDDYIPNKIPPNETKSQQEARTEIAALKETVSKMQKQMQQKEQEMLVLEAMVERREKMIEENRKLFYRELLALKEEQFKQLLLGKFEFIENEKFMEDIPRDLQTASMYYNAGAVIKGLQKIKQLETRIEKQQQQMEALQQQKEKIAKKELEMLEKLDVAHKDTQKYISEYEIAKSKMMELQSTVEEQNETLEMLNPQLQSLKDQIQQLESEIADKDEKLSLVQDSANQIENMRRNSESLSTELEHAKSQIQNLHKEKVRRDSELSTLSQVQEENHSLYEQISTLNQKVSHQTETIQHLETELESLRGTKPRGGQHEAWAESEPSAGGPLDRHGKEGINELLSDSEKAHRAHSGRDSSLLRKFSFSSSREGSLSSPRSKPPLSPSGSTSSRPLKARKKMKDLQKMRKNKRFSQIEIDSWSDREEGFQSSQSLLTRSTGASHTTKGEKKGKSKNKGISSVTFQRKKSSLNDEDLRNTFGVLADTLEEFDGLQMPMDESEGVQNQKQKEQAQYLLQQYYLYREKNEVLKRLEKRTKLMYERVRLKKKVLEQEKQEQIERCLSVYQLLSTTHPEEVGHLERQHMQQLAQEYEASRGSKQSSEASSVPLHNPALNQLRKFQTPSPSMSDTIRRPKSAAATGPPIPGSQNRFHVTKRRTSLDERSMGDLFSCRTMTGTPSPKKQRPRPHSSAAMMRPPRPKTINSPAQNQDAVVYQHTTDEEGQQQELYPQNMHLTGEKPPTVETSTAFRAASAPPELHEKQDRYRPEKKKKKSARGGNKLKKKRSASAMRRRS